MPKVSVDLNLILYFHIYVSYVIWWCYFGLAIMVQFLFLSSLVFLNNYLNKILIIWRTHVIWSIKLLYTIRIFEVYNKCTVCLSPSHSPSKMTVTASPDRRDGGSAQRWGPPRRVTLKRRPGAPLGVSIVGGKVRALLCFILKVRNRCST